MPDARSRRGWAGGRRTGGSRCAAAGVVLGWLALASCNRSDPPSVAPEDRGASAPAAVSVASGAAFLREITPGSGIDFVHHVTSDGEYRMPELLGGGCAVFDANGDGRMDLYFVDSGNGPEDGAPNRLFVRGEDGTYSDATAASGLGDRGFGLGVALGDVDNDGDLDVYVGNWGRDRLYLNDGAGRFEDATERAGLAGAALTASAGFLDYDRDGHLDLFVVHHVAPDPEIVCHGRGKGREFCTPRAYRHVPDTLYRNRGDGTFEDVSERSGIGTTAAPGLALAVADYDGDGRLDVYVANDQVANHLWMNQGDGTFANEAIARGAAYNALAAAEASMGVAVADVNGDGRQDIWCSHLAGETNTLYLGREGGAFTDASSSVAPGRPSYRFTGWGIALLDIEHDGDLDLAVANGSAVRGEPHEAADVPAFWRPYAEPNQLLVNDGTPRFDDASDRGGAFCGPGEVSRALAAVDLDGDGDLDLVLTNVAGPARIFENVAPKAGHWLRVRAVDGRLRREALGAVVALVGNRRARYRVVGGPTSYLTAIDAAVHFGLATDETVDAALVTWTDGATERFAVDGLDREIVLVRGAGSE